MWMLRGKVSRNEEASVALKSHCLRRKGYFLLDCINRAGKKTACLSVMTFVSKIANLQFLWVLSEV